MDTSDDRTALIARSAAIGVRMSLAPAEPSRELASALNAGSAFPFVGLSRGSVLSGVSVDSQEFKVFNPVVSAIFVAVVNVLVLEKTAAKMLFHDETVLKNIEAASGDLNIAIRSERFSDSAIACTTASL